MSHSLLSLYQSILVFILSQWISDEDLGCVDTAVCNTKQRKFLLLMLTKCSAANMKPKNRIDWFAWVLLRGVRLREINLSDIQKYTQLQYDSVLDSVAKKWSTNLHSELKFVNPGVRCLKLTRRSDMLPLRCKNGLNLSVCCSVAQTIFSEAQELGIESLHLTMYFDQWSDEDMLPTVEIRVDEIHGAAVTSVENPRTHSDNDIESISPYMNQLKSLCLFKADNPILWNSLLLLCNQLTDLNLILVDMDTETLKTIMTNCPMLKSFQYNGYYVSNYPTWSLSNLASCCPNIEYFCLMRVKCDASDFESFLKACPLLTFLSANTSITSETLNRLVVGYESLELTRYSFIKLSNSHRLKGITVGNDHLTQNQCVTMFTSNPMLRRIKLHSQVVIDSTIDTLIQLCPLLENICLNGCSQLTIQAFRCIAECKHLRSLSLIDCLKMLCNADVEDFLRKQTTLTMLSLPQKPNITAAVLTFITRNCPNMRHVDLSYNKHIQTSDVIMFLKTCSKLNYLNISCTNVGMEIFAHLKIEQMRYLNVRGCKIPYQFLDDFKSATGFEWIV